MSQFLFPKEEKLKSVKVISRLFREGKSFFSYPVKFVYLSTPSSSSPGIKIAVSVSAKKFKKATDRNLIKRRLRESYRLNKNLLSDSYKPANLLVEGMFIYVANDICDYNTFSSAVQKILVSLDRGLTQDLPVADKE